MALFVSSIGLKLASGGKIPSLLFFFFPLFRAQFFCAYATLTCPLLLFICQPCIPCYIYYTNFWRYLSSCLLPFFRAIATREFCFENIIFFPFFPTSYLKLDTALRRHLYTMFDNVRPHRLLSFVCVPTEWSQLYTFEQILFVQTQRQWYIE